MDIKQISKDKKKGWTEFIVTNIEGSIDDCWYGFYYTPKEGFHDYIKNHIEKQRKYNLFPFSNNF